MKDRFYVARDKDGDLWMFRSMGGESAVPVKRRDDGIWDSDGACEVMQLSSKMLPDVKWKDSEPKEVYIIEGGIKFIKEVIGQIKSLEDELCTDPEFQDIILDLFDKICKKV